MSPRSDDPGGETTTGMDVRRPVAVLLSRFPTVTETFILREIDEMERQGQPVRLVPLLREDPPVVHEQARPWTERALFTPFVSLGIVGANLRAFLGAPLRYLSVLKTLIFGMSRSPDFLIRSVALFPKSVYLAERLEAEGIRHVHAHFATHPATVAWLVARLSGLSYSITIHAHDIFVDQTFLREKLEAARFVRVISEFNRSYLRARVPELDPETVKVVHVGVPVSRYVLDPGPERSGPGDEPRGATGSGAVPADGDARGDAPPLIVTVASLQEYKGIPVLLAACRALEDAGVEFRCQVAGAGPLREELEARTSELRLADRVRFLGAIPEDEIPELLSRTSVFVLPSVVQEDGQMEGIPVALMEAMAAGVPVVASDLSGIPELVDDGNTGILTAPGHATDVAAAVRSLLERPGWARTLGLRGQERVREAFSLEGTAARLLELLGKHVGGGGREIRDRLSRSGPLRSRTGAVGVRRVHGGRDSWVAELLLGSGDELRAGDRIPDERAPWPREVVLKVHRSRPGASRPATDRARTEFDVLRDLAAPARTAGGDGAGRHGSGRDVPLGAPRPLHLDEPSATLLMTRCDGDSLLELLRASRWRPGRGAPGRLASAVCATGRWLRAFQEGTRTPGSAAAALDRTTLDALESVDRIRGDALDPGDARAAMERILALRSEADPGSIRVLRHGDFWPGNVRVSDDGGVAVLDFEGAAPGHPLEDPAYFEVHLTLYLAYPGLQARRGALREAFLDGYGDPAVAATPAFDLCRRSAAARLLEEPEEDGPLPAPGAWFRKRTLLEVLEGRDP